jgi:hypothetical protein
MSVDSGRRSLTRVEGLSETEGCWFESNRGSRDEASDLRDAGQRPVASFESLAGLVIAAVAVREGLEAWRGEGCACAPALLGVAAGDNPQAESFCADDCCAHESPGRDL